MWWSEMKHARAILQAIEALGQLGDLSSSDFDHIQCIVQMTPEIRKCFAKLISIALGTVVGSCCCDPAERIPSRLGKFRASALWEIQVTMVEAYGTEACLPTMAKFIAYLLMQMQFLS